MTNTHWCVCCMWECREFGRAAKFFFSSSFIWKCLYIFFVFSRVAFVQCVFFSSIWFAPSEQEPKNAICTCVIFWGAVDRFSFYLVFFFFCFARDKCEWNDEFYSYIQTHEIISIYIIFFSHIILRHVQLWVPFFLPCHKCSTEWLM